MRDTEVRQLLKFAEEQFEPPADFVERLSAELVSVAANVPTPAPRSSRAHLMVGLAAAVAAVFIGVAIFVAGDTTPATETPLANASATAAGKEAGAAEAAEAVPLSVSGACRSFLIDAAPIVTSGRVQTVGLTPAPASRGGESSVSSPLYELRDSLGVIADWYGRNPDADPAVTDGLTGAVGELGQAALLVQLGESSEAQRRIDKARGVLGDLAGEPKLAACFDL